MLENLGDMHVAPGTDGAVDQASVGLFLASLIDAFTACAAEGRDLPGRGHERTDSEPGAGRRAGAVPGREHGRGARHD